MPPPSDQPPGPFAQVPERRVLLAVTGLTPQVVTETLFALMGEGQDALPHEVHVLTTTEGAERARLALLSDQPGWFYRLRHDLALPPIEFGPQHIHVLRDAHGHPLSDIRTAQDNACAADQVAELIRRFTQDMHSRLHVSQAGGRPIALAPAELAFLAWFARRATLGLPGLPCPADGAPSLEFAAAYLAEYRRIRGHMGDDGRSTLRYRHGMSKADFEERKSKLKRALTAQLGPAALAYLVVGAGRRPMRYRLALPADAIDFARP